jgi:hypothetical protein
MIKAATGKNLNIPLFTYRDDCKKNEYSKKANNVSESGPVLKPISG